MRKLKLEELNRISKEQFHVVEKIPVIVVLDNIRSMHNVGSVFRTADAFLVEAIYLCGITAKPPHREIEKTALGATDSVKWKYFQQSDDALKTLIEKGYLPYAVEQVENGCELSDFVVQKNKKYALVFGNEITGVSEEALLLCEQAIEIPQFGTKHSFNISVSAGIVLWHFHESLRKLSYTI